MLDCHLPGEVSRIQTGIRMRKDVVELKLGAQPQNYSQSKTLLELVGAVA